MFTFKKNIPTGKYKSFETESHEIKIKRKLVGHINQPSHFSNEEDFYVMFSIKKEATKNSPASFKWITLKRRFKTADEAKTFLNKNFERLTKQFDLYYFDN